MRILLAVIMLSGTVFASGCGGGACGGNACLPAPPPRRPVAEVYSDPFPSPAPVVENSDVAYCNPCAGF